MTEKNESGKQPLVSIIIVNYNGGRFLADCLDSLAAKISVEFEVVLVDNGSDMDGCDHVEGRYPWLTVVKHDRNLGFAGGNNLGARYARGRYLLLLNNDTVLLTDIRDAVELLARDESVGVVGAKMLGARDEYRRSAGHFPAPWRLLVLSSLYLKRQGFSSGNFSEGLLDVDWVEGSFLLTRKTLWEQLGGLDESYFMYVEDVDYCRGARLLGLRTVYLPSACYRHYGGYGAGRLHMLVAGFLRYHRKYSGKAARLAALVVLQLGLRLRCAAALGGGMVAPGPERRQKFDACLDALRVCKW